MVELVHYIRSLIDCQTDWVSISSLSLSIYLFSVYFFCIIIFMNILKFLYTSIEKAQDLMNDDIVKRNLIYINSKL